MSNFKDREFNMVSALNTYVWKVLEANVGLVKSDYNGLTPIIPRQQQPEFLTYAKPFLVYGSAIHPGTDFWGVRKESIAYNIYSTSSGMSNAIANLLALALERQDETATDINKHLDSMVGHGDVPRKITFGSVKVTVTNDSAPADEEGGFYTSLVMLEVVYTVYPVIKTTDFSYAASGL